MYYLLDFEKEWFKQNFPKFLHSLVWGSNILDGFTKEEITNILNKLNNDDEFIAKLVENLGQLIDTYVADEV